MQRQPAYSTYIKKPTYPFHYNILVITNFTELILGGRGRGSVGNQQKTNVMLDCTAWAINWRS